jgi:hypothetical protein
MEHKREHPITGKEGSPIELEVAASWTKNYRTKHPREPISQFFGKEILENILSQEGCLGIRFYYAHDHEDKRHLIMTGVMSDGSDQIHEKPYEAATAAAPGGPVIKAAVTAARIYTIGEMSTPCPGSPGCPQNALTGQEQ